MTLTTRSAQPVQDVLAGAGLEHRVVVPIG